MRKRHLTIVSSEVLQLRCRSLQDDRKRAPRIEERGRVIRSAGGGFFQRWVQLALERFDIGG